MRNYIFILFVLLQWQLFAQSFTAVVNKNKIAENEQVQLEFRVTDIKDASNFTPPAFTGFDAYGPNQLNSTTLINGVKTQTTTISYVLRPRNIGKFTIGSANIKAGGSSYTTQPVTIEVTDNPVSSNNQNSAEGSADLISYAKENCYMRTEVSDQSIYKGEEIIVTHKLYVARGAFIDLQPKGAQRNPKFNGFYAEDIALTNNQEGGMEVVNGKQYQVYEVKKSKLTAQQAGELEIDPLQMDLVFAVKSKSKKKSMSPFITNYEKVELTLASPDIKINVSDLPSNAPSDFNGAVGSFEMQTELNTTETKTDEPLTYSVIIKGKGNLKLFEAPVLNLPPGWETYDPNVKETNMARTYEYLLIPRSPGEFTIPAHTWSYFDPNKKQYVTLASEPYAVNVEVGQNYSGTTSQTMSKEDVEMLNADIRFIKKEKPAYNNGGERLDPILFYSAVCAPFLLSIIVFIFSVKKNKLESDVVGLKNRMATTVAKKRLAKANEFSRKNESKNFYDETIRALWGYLSDKFNIPKSKLSKENINGYLLKHHVTEETSSAMMDLLNQCEFALFAPQSIPGELQQTYRKAIEIITKLEGEIK